MTPTLSELCSQYDEISQTKGFGNGVKNAKRFATRAFEELGTDRVEKKDLFDNIKANKEDKKGGFNAALKFTGEAFIQFKRRMA